MNLYRAIVVVVIGSLSLSAASTQEPKKKADKSDLELIQGTWKVVKLESKGRENKVLPDSKWVVDGDKATMFEGKNEAVTFRFKLAPTRDPKAIDLTATRNGKDLDTIPGIYSISGDDLRICINFDKVRPQAFATPADAPQEILTFRRGEPDKIVWKDIEAKEGFVVALPGKPELTDLSAPTALGAVTGKQYKIRHDSLRVSFMAQAFIYAADVKLPETAKHLEIERAALIQNLPGSKVIAEKKIKIGEHPGIEVHAEFLEGKAAMRTRVFIVNGRVFCVNAVGVNEDVFSKDADRFLDSFKLK